MFPRRAVVLSRCRRAARVSCHEQRRAASVRCPATAYHRVCGLCPEAPDVTAQSQRVAVVRGRERQCTAGLPLRVRNSPAALRRRGLGVARACRRQCRRGTDRLSTRRPNALLHRAAPRALVGDEADGRDRAHRLEPQRLSRCTGRSAVAGSTTLESMTPAIRSDGFASRFLTSWRGMPGMRPTAELRIGDVMSVDVQGASPSIPHVFDRRAAQTVVSTIWRQAQSDRARRRCLTDECAMSHATVRQWVHPLKVVVMGGIEPPTCGL